MATKKKKAAKAKARRAKAKTLSASSTKAEIVAAVDAAMARKSPSVKSSEAKIRKAVKTVKGRMKKKVAAVANTVLKSADRNPEAVALMAEVIEKAVKPRKKTAKKASKAAKPRKKAAKKVETITADTVIKGSVSTPLKMWLCAGPKRTGCGGGKRGGHVVPW